ncbi:MAG: hypothetical protein V4820_00290 [Pseudomonadota bacterium]
MTELLGMFLLAILPVMIVIGAAATFMLETADLRRAEKQAKEEAAAARAARRRQR